LLPGLLQAACQQKIWRNFEEIFWLIGRWAEVDRISARCTRQKLPGSDKVLTVEA
jgi:hypothetical protein